MSETILLGSLFSVRARCCGRLVFFISIFYVLWGVWLEKNSGIFKDIREIS